MAYKLFNFNNFVQHMKSEWAVIVYNKYNRSFMKFTMSIDQSDDFNPFIR